jgi:hypothetical protein
LEPKPGKFGKEKRESKDSNYSAAELDAIRDIIHVSNVQRHRCADCSIFIGKIEGEMFAI